MGESRQLKDDHFESLEVFIRLQCRKIDELKEMQKNSGAKEPVPDLLILPNGKCNLKTWLKVDGMELSSIDECKKYLGNNLPNNDFVRAFFFNSTGKIGLFRRFFTDPIPGYYLTTDTIAVDLLVQVGFHFSSLIH